MDKKDQKLGQNRSHSLNNININFLRQIEKQVLQEIEHEIKQKIVERTQKKVQTEVKRQIMQQIQQQQLGVEFQPEQIQIVIQ